MKAMFPMLLAGAVLVAAPAAAAEHDPALIVALSLFHEDPDPAELERFRPGLADALEAVATDGSVPRLARIRALAALAHEDADRGEPLVHRLLEDRAVHMRLRLAAAWTLGHRLASRPGTVPALSRALADTDPGLREQAVRSLDAVGTDAARAVLAQHRIAERHVVVRTALRELEERDGVSLPRRRDGHPIVPEVHRTAAPTDGEVVR